MKVKIGDICTLKSGTSLKDDILNESNGVPYIKVSDMNLVGNEKYIVRANSYADESISEKMLFPKGTVLFPKRGGAIGTNKKRIASKTVCADLNTMGVIPSDKIRPLYLYYYFQNIDFGTLYNGSSVPQINNTDIAPMEINLIPLEEQDDIVALLEKTDEIVRKRKEELQLLDDLIKARFVELFGMPGTDTKGWGLLALGECCELNPKKAKDNRLQSGLEVSFVPMPAVSENGEIDASDIKAYDEVKTGFTYFSENDVLFAKITPCMENGKGAVAVGLYNGIGFGSTEFHVLRPLEGKSNSYWLYSLTSFDSFRKDAVANMTGSAGQRRVPVTFLENYKVTLPPIELQENFSDFVNQVDKSKLAELFRARDASCLKGKKMRIRNRSTALNLPCKNILNSLQRRYYKNNSNEDANLILSKVS